MTLDDPAAAPVLARVGVKLDEDADSVDVGTVKVVPAQWPARVEPLARLGEGVELAAAELSTTTAAPGESVDVRVGWQVVAPPGPTDLHLFVHLGDPTQAPLAQADGPPNDGLSPTTIWQPGDVVRDVHRFPHGTVWRAAASSPAPTGLTPVSAPRRRWPARRYRIMLLSYE